MLPTTRGEFVDEISRLKIMFRSFDQLSEYDWDRLTSPVSSFSQATAFR